MKVEHDAQDLLNTQVKMVGIIQDLSDEIQELREELRTLAKGQEAGDSELRVQKGRPEGFVSCQFLIDKINI